MSKIANDLEERLQKLCPAAAPKIMRLLRGEDSPLDSPAVLSWAASADYYPSEVMQTAVAVAALLPGGNGSPKVVSDPFNGGVVILMQLGLFEFLAYSSAKDTWAIRYWPKVVGSEWDK